MIYLRLIQQTSVDWVVKIVEMCISRFWSLKFWKNGSAVLNFYNYTLWHKKLILEKSYNGRNETNALMMHSYMWGLIFLSKVLVLWLKNIQNVLFSWCCHEISLYELMRTHSLHTIFFNSFACKLYWTQYATVMTCYSRCANWCNSCKNVYGENLLLY